MKRHLALTTLSVMLLGLFLVTVDAWARAGGGSSGGSRGSRSYSAPARPSQGMSPSRPSSPSAVQPPMAPQRSWMSGIMGGIGGLVLGGLIGSMLFGGMGGLGGLGGGLLGGIGLMEILIVAALAYFGYSYLKRRQASTPAPAGYPTSYSGAGAPQPTWRPDPASAATAVAEPMAGPSDLERGIAHVRQMDAAFDPARFADTASDLFFKVQAAWMSRDMGSVRDRLTSEMFAVLQRDCDRLRADRRINRLENIAVRSVEMTEAWQESGQDYVTVAFVANLLDFTTDESGTQVLDGSRTEPVKFEEYWTLTRPVGPNSWKLSAIQQPQ